jgi:sugar lactone lactonase YvrE
MRFHLGALAAVVAAVTKCHALEVVEEWVTADYDWDEQARASALASGEYIIEHNTITGIKVCGPGVSTRCLEEQVFVTVPRWATGVPGTLNLVVHNSTGHAVLRPWPSLEAQSPHDCEKIQYVQSMEIDPRGIMWVVDVGRKYFTEPEAVDNSCPPKMVLVDVPTGEIVETYVFPSEVTPYDGAFLNDIVVDVPNEVAYLTSTGNNASDLGALVVYDRRFKRSRRFEDRTTHAENLGADIQIHGSDFTRNLAGFPVDGIALSPRADRLYYCPLGGFHLYSIDTAILRDFTSSLSSVATTIIDHGAKPSNNDGMAMGSDGDLFFGGITTDTLYRWTPASGSVQTHALGVVTDPENLWWVDTHAFDNLGNLWVTSNKLNTWFFGGTVPPAMDFSGASGANFRIVKLPVGTNSYMKGQLFSGSEEAHLV